MKLRETLMDQGEGFSTIVCPSGISIYPHNRLYLVFFIFSLVCAIIGMYLIKDGLEDL